MAPESLDARQSYEAKSLCQSRSLRALAGSSDAASAARVGALKRAYATRARDELEAALVVEGTPPLDLARSFGFI